MAQLVEHHLAKVGVAGSSPVSRSIIKISSIAFAVLLILVIGHLNRDGTTYLDFMSLRNEIEMFPYPRLALFYEFCRFNYRLL